MGGGALSSKNESKLVEFCHCEERSDVAIAKSLHIDEITTSHFTNAPRNDKSSSKASETNLTTYRLNDSTPFPDTVFSRFTSHFLHKRVAFTLAEVLITLGIIGIVVALTLPTLVANYKEKVLVNQVKKAYSEMQNALKMYSAQNNCSDITCISDTNQTSAELADKLFAQFQGAQRCPGTWNINRKMCKTIQIKEKTPYYSNGVTASGDSFSPYFISANGVAYKVIQNSQCPREYEYTVVDENGFPVLDENGNPKKKKGVTKNCALFYFDANGVNKGPNQFGADIYRFNITYDGKFVNYGDTINPVLTKGKLEYTPYELGQPKK